MLTALLHAARQRNTTDPVNFPDLPAGAVGLPRLTDAPCAGAACGRCVTACPTGAIELLDGDDVSLDRGRCISCGACMTACPSGTIAADRATATAVLRREDLLLRRRPKPTPPPAPAAGEMFRRSVDLRVVSTGCSATDLEVAAMSNPTFDASRFGIQVVASPRFADALLVTGPVGRAMQAPLFRCIEAMTDPKIVIAVGTCAVSGGIHRDGPAEARGVTPHLDVAAFVPGCPPHPWSILHGILLAIGRTGSSAG